MKLEGDYLFEATVAEVWSALFDPVILAAVMPGCEKLDLVDGQYVGEIKVKVGPIQGKFAGKVDLKDKDEPRSYTMIVDGRGAPGFVKATAAVKLAAEGTGTRVYYDADAQIGGKIASVGQRLIEASARAIVAQSLEGLHTNIKLRAAAYREAAASQAPAEPAAVVAAEPSAQGASPATETAPVTASSPAAAAPSPTTTTASATTGAPSEITAAPPAPSAPTPAAAVSSAAPSGTTAAPSAAAPASSAAAARPIAFTPVKTKQSDLANAVAREVASSLFPRKVLVAIIVLQAIVIVWLAVRH
jgi:carbon monoxide dehydrogenase subunit G